MSKILLRKIDLLRILRMNSPVIVLTLVAFLTFGVTGVYAMGKEDAEPPKSQKNIFSEAKSAVNSGRYQSAIQLLQQVIDQDPNNADAHNYLGFSYRKIGKLDLAAESYNQVFSVDPNHKGALEYQGELYLKLGNLTSAQMNLAKLARLCPSSCKEFAELKRAIADFTITRGVRKGS